MDINEAAKKLRLSQRQIRRLILIGALPAKKVKKLIEVEVDAWEIDDNAIKVARDVVGRWQKYETFAEWMIEKMKELDIKPQELSKRTGLPILEFANDPAMIMKLGSGESEVRDKIIAAIIRATIERRFGNVQ